MLTPEQLAFFTRNRANFMRHQHCAKWVFVVKYRQPLDHKWSVSLATVVDLAMFTRLDLMHGVVE